MKREHTMDALTQINLRTTAQNQQADGRQVPNSAGGFTFTLDDEARLRRFLFLGTDGGTYYVSQQDLTKGNAEVVLRMAAGRGADVVRIVREVSLAGRAPKQNATLFTLAAVTALGDDAARRDALDAVSVVVRTGTHLFLFARYVEQFRGWGRGLRRAVGSWYTDKSATDLAYQVAKYGQREGWSHRDLLRLAHPATQDPAMRAVFDYACGRPDFDSPDLPGLLTAVRALETATPAETVALIGEHPISWEMLPDRLVTDKTVWDALLAKGLPITALIRQLPRITNLGLARHPNVAARLTDEGLLTKGRVHPASVLIAMRTYAAGRGVRGAQTWTPDRVVLDALDAAFYASFGTIEATGKRILLALDVSGSMMAPIGGLPITAREAVAAMAMATARTETGYEIVGFTGGSTGHDWRRNTTLTPLTISPRQRMDDVLRATTGLPFGATDCALPYLWAAEQGKDFDAVVVYTDSETWAGATHPHQALATYRQRVGHDVKSIVVGTTSTGFSIADPADTSSLDVVGFDSAVPNLISDFVRGV
jgi:60 kDa SS-A/Ro ribonucleoprotein